MTDVSPHSARNTVFGDLDGELARTRRVLERIPDEHWSWKPHAKSGALGEVASHVAQLPYLGAMILDGTELDVSGRRPRVTPTTRDELLAVFDQACDALRTAIDSVPMDDWGTMWTLRNGEHVIATMPRAAALRALGISHQIHHRGQLTVYLRLLDVPVPGVYGPSADER